MLSKEANDFMYEPGDYIKVEFKDEQSGESEWMWVNVTGSDDRQRVVFGKLDSGPIAMTDLHLGMELAVSYDNIRDHRKPASFKPI
jgi:uncharacterized protein YegJ (DUF2314 family)